MSIYPPTLEVVWSSDLAQYFGFNKQPHSEESQRRAASPLKEHIETDKPTAWTWVYADAENVTTFLGCTFLKLENIEFLLINSTI